MKIVCMLFATTLVYFWSIGVIFPINVLATIYLVVTIIFGCIPFLNNVIVYFSKNKH